MDGQRFDTLVRAMGGGMSRRWVLGGALTAALAGLRPGRLVAQDDTTAAGTGGNATASANGGAIVIGNVDSGGNVGGTVSVGNVWDGAVAVQGGDVTTTTTVGVTANGGTAIADAGGGSGNVAVDGGDGGWVACNCNACATGEFCCNWSCGVCAPNGGSCDQRACVVCVAA